MSLKREKKRHARSSAAPDVAAEPCAVFISYAHKDAVDLAFRLQQDLSARGFSVWLDASRIRGGASWSVEIEKALDRSDVVLALMSAASFVSDVCRGEQLRSLRNGKCVIPVLVQRDADRPVYLECAHYRDFSEDTPYQEGFRQLLLDIGARQKIELQPRYFRTNYETVPPLPLSYVERADALNPLRAALMSDDVARQVAVTGVRGMGGVGKTVLAQALCRRDEAVQAAFPDGIAWVTIGQEPGNLVAQMRDVARALGEPTTGFDTPEQSTQRLRAILREKAALIVLDDVWDSQFVEPFRAEAPRCKIVFTTREASVAAALGAFEHCVDVLEPPKALEILARYARTAIESLPVAAHEIIRECGYLPLAVAMIGAMARGKPDRWEVLLRQLRSADLGKIRLKFPSYRYPSLLKAIQISVDSLEPDLRDRYYDLAAFAADVPVPEAALAVLWNCDRDTTQGIADRFVDASLAGRDRRGRLALHDLQGDFVRQHAEGPSLIALHNKLLDAYALKCKHGWPSGPNDGYFFQQVSYHLREAKRESELQDLLVGFDWLRAKLAATDVQQLLNDFERFAAGQDARLVHEALGLSAHVLDNDSNQLTQQLVARLYDVKSGPIEDMLSRARMLERGWWLEPVLSCLARPGDPLERTIRVGEPVRSVAITPDAALALSGGRRLKLWDLKTGQERCSIDVKSGNAYIVAITPDGTRAISVSVVSGDLKAWDLAAGRELHAFQRSGGWLRSATVTPDGKCVIAGSNGGDLEIWDFETGQQTPSIKTQDDEINALAVTPDGRLLISTGSDASLNVWDLKTRRWLNSLRGHRDEGNAVTVTADGTHVVSGSFDGSLKYWNLETGQELCSLDLEIVNRDYCVTAVGVAPSGKRAVSASFDGSVTIWDLESGAAKRTWQWHRVREDDIAMKAIAITPDCRRALSVSSEWNLQLWNLEKGAIHRQVTWAR